MNTEARPGCSETIRELLSRATHELAESGIEAPHLTAELLLGHVLGWDRVRVVTGSQDQIDPDQNRRFHDSLRRRIQGEPLQYITGKQEFYGLTFNVSPDVLIPRPETEILVETVLNLAGQSRDKPVRFVDVGTGSGCIAVSIGKHMPRWLGWAVDLSSRALLLAWKNAARHKVAQRIQFICGDMLNSFAPEPAFDFILSNPPYIARRDAATLPSVVHDYEPHLALFSGELGLESYSRLLPQAAERLFDGGYLLLEVGIGQSRDVARLVTEQALVMDEIVEDLQGIPRCLVAHKP